MLTATFECNKRGLRAQFTFQTHPEGHDLVGVYPAMNKAIIDTMTPEVRARPDLDVYGITIALYDIIKEQIPDLVSVRVYAPSNIWWAEFSGDDDEDERRKEAAR